MARLVSDSVYQTSRRVAAVWLVVVVTLVLDGASGKSLVLVGGGQDEMNAEVYNTIVLMAGGKGYARIGIVTAPSADPNDSFQYYKDLFVNVYGAASVAHINVGVNNLSVAFDPALVATVRNMTGFFFSGGDQSRVVQSMYRDGRLETPVLTAIRERFEAGAVVSGTSAGAACMSSAVMVTDEFRSPGSHACGPACMSDGICTFCHKSGTKARSPCVLRGLSWDALRWGAQTSSHQAYDLTYDPEGGIGFLDGYVIDTHFADRGREGRLIRLLSDSRGQRRGTAWGIGIDEDTVLVISDVGAISAIGTVLGTGGVTFIDVTAAIVDSSQRYFTIRDVSVTYLTHGDQYNLATHQVSFALDKIPLLGNELYTLALTSDDIFYGRRSSTLKPEFVRAATSIFDARAERSTYGLTKERSPCFQVDMYLVSDKSVGYVKRMTSFHSDLHSYKNMRVDISQH